LGHEIAVESQPGQGSKFAVVVPKADSQGQFEALSGEDTTPTHASGDTILLVDDDAAVAEASQMLLVIEGFKVCVANSKDQALTKAENSVPDLIVTDYHLTEGDTGIELVEEIRRVTGQDIPAILVTGDTSSLITKVSELGNCQTLCKPVDVDKLIQLTHTVLAETRAKAELKP
jgi:DNA-binding NtrC family response regulator